MTPCKRQAVLPERPSREPEGTKRGTYRRPSVLRLGQKDWGGGPRPSVPGRCPGTSSAAAAATVLPACRTVLSTNQRCPEPCRLCSTQGQAPLALHTAARGRTATAVGPVTTRTEGDPFYVVHSMRRPSTVKQFSLEPVPARLAPMYQHATTRRDRRCCRPAQHNLRCDLIRRDARHSSPITRGILMTPEARLPRAKTEDFVLSALRDDFH